MLPTLPMIGHWHTHEFAAAIVPAHRILAEKTRQAETDEFLLGSIDVVLKLLS